MKKRLKYNRKDKILFFEKTKLTLHIYTHTHTHIYIYIYIHTHTHIYIWHLYKKKWYLSICLEDVFHVYSLALYVNTENFFYPVYQFSSVTQSGLTPFSSCPQSLPASGSFPMSQLFTWGGQSIGVSASASVLPMNTQDWSPLGWI